MVPGGAGRDNRDDHVVVLAVPSAGIEDGYEVTKRLGLLDSAGALSMRPIKKL